MVGLGVVGTRYTVDHSEGFEGAIIIMFNSGLLVTKIKMRS